MRLFEKIYFASLSLLVAVGVLSGCQKESDGSAKAVLASATSLTFPAQSPVEQIITIYSDGEWTVEVPEWVSVSPTSGAGTVDVTISVSENLRDGTPDNPRKANVVFKGKTIASEAVVVVQQEGEKYRDIKDYTISEVKSSEDETVVIVPDVQVMALCGTGAMVADGSDAIFAVLDTTGIKIGDVVKISGDKGTDNSLPVISNTDEVSVTSHSDVSYPDAVEMTSPDSYEATDYDYITVLGLLTDKSVAVGSFNEDNEFEEDTTQTMTLNVLAPYYDLKLGDVSGHVVRMTAYTAGIAKPVINVVAVSVEDLGAAIKMPLYYENWQGQPSEKNKVADWVTTNMIGTGVDGVTYAAGSQVDIRWTYKQGTKNSDGSGFKYLTYDNELFPGYDAYSQGNSAAHLYAGTGTYNASESWVEIRNIKMKEQKALQFGMAIFGVADYADEKECSTPYPVYYKFDTDEDWTLLSNVKFTGNWHWYTLPAFAVPDGATTVSLRFEPLAANYARVDDCTLVEADPSEVDDTPVTYITLTSDSSVELEARGGDFTVTFKSNLTEFTNNVSDISWLSVKSMDYADDVYTVTLTAAENEGEAREAELKLSSSDGSASATVKVSQAAMEISPFISIATGNSVTALPEGETISVTVQHSVEYQTESNADWISEVPATKTFVDNETVQFEVSKNTSGALRTGTIRFYNETSNLESVLTITQDVYVSPLPSNVLYYETLGEVSATTKLSDMTWDKTGSGADNVTYVGGSKIDVRKTCNQGATTSNGSYNTYSNGLISGFTSSPDANLYFGNDSSTDLSESWFEIQGIAVGTAEALQFGMGLYYDISKTDYADNPMHVSYKFDTQTEWTSLNDIYAQRNWYWYSTEVFDVPSGASSVSIRLQSSIKQMFRADDFTLISTASTSALFSDDFSWMDDLIAEYVAAGTAIGQSVEDNNPSGSAPNMYSATPKIATELYNQGYVDIHPEWKVVYPQNAYFKFGKTCDKKVASNGKYNVTGLILPDFYTSSSSSSITVTFNWACHRRVLNEGTESETKETDPVKIVVEVVKNVLYVTDCSAATTYDVVWTSDAVATTQPDDTMEWQTATFTVPDFQSGYRLLIRPENMTPEASTVNRWYLDNIKIKK